MLSGGVASVVYILPGLDLQGCIGSCPAELSIRQRDAGLLLAWDRYARVRSNGTRTDRVNVGLEACSASFLQTHFRVQCCRFRRQLATSGRSVGRGLGSTLHVAWTDSFSTAHAANARPKRQLQLLSDGND